MSPCAYCFHGVFLLYGPKVIQVVPYSELSGDTMTVYTAMTSHALISLTGFIRRVRIKGHLQEALDP